MFCTTDTEKRQMRDMVRKPHWCKTFDVERNWFSRHFHHDNTKMRKSETSTKGRVVRLSFVISDFRDFVTKNLTSRSRTKEQHNSPKSEIRRLDDQLVLGATKALTLALSQRERGRRRGNRKSEELMTNSSAKPLARPTTISCQARSRKALKSETWRVDDQLVETDRPSSRTTRRDGERRSRPGHRFRTAA